METLNEVLYLIIEYLKQSIQPATGLDWFNKYGIPIIQTLILLGGAGAGLYKYFSVKNMEINEKILREVYSPLFQYLIKQELLCFINNYDRNQDESPILEFISEKKTIKGNVAFSNSLGFDIKTSTETLLGLDREQFLKVLDSVNIGLASKELLTLLNMYQVLIYAEKKQGETTEGYLNSTLMKIDVEKALVIEIIEGYYYFYKKLGLEEMNTNNFYKIEDGKIVFTYKVDKAKKEQLLSKIIENAKQ